MVVIRRQDEQHNRHNIQIQTRLSMVPSRYI
jgi:hypothetical protein